MNAVNFASNAVQAAKLPYLNLPRSIFGDRASWQARSHGLLTEYAAIWPLTHLPARRSLIATLLPDFEWKRSLQVLPKGALPVSMHSQIIPARGRERRGERWFYLNGICSDTRVARINVLALRKLFRRPVMLLHNDTQGLVLDLAECVAGKAMDVITDSVLALFPPILEALTDPARRRVIIVAHSQGTILASVMLKMLEELLQLGVDSSGQHADEAARRGLHRHPASPERQLARRIIDEWPIDTPSPWQNLVIDHDCIARLELYCFANAATSMEPFAVSHDGRPIPWIESFGNEYDAVARLGLLAPPHGWGSTRITGERYFRPGRWGHLLNAHYQPAPAGWRPLEALRGNCRDQPRLYDYVGGRAPPALARAGRKPSPVQQAKRPPRARLAKRR